MLKEITISWSAIDHLIEKLSRKLELYMNENPDSIKAIYGIPRGGLIPAVMLSHLLKLPLADNYQDDTTLVVDDIADSGETLEGINNLTAVLYYKPATSKIVPSFIGKEHHSDEWLIFPWESQASSKVQGYKKVKEYLASWQLEKLSDAQLRQVLYRVEQYIDREYQGVKPEELILRNLTQAIASNVLAEEVDLGRQI